MSDIYSIGISALAAAQAGLVTTGQNISNANTAGYHRQQIVQSASTPLQTGSGFLGQGVQVDTVKRVYSQFLDQQVNQAQGQASYYTTYQTQLSQIDNLLGSSGSGVAPALQNFFQSVSAVSANASDMPTRQSMVSSASALVTQFNSMAAQLTSMRGGVNSQIASTVSQVNTCAQQIAAINGQILAAQQNPGQPPNDLLDQQGALVSQLNQLVGANVVNNSDGTINVSIGNGQSLVTGSQVMKLTAAASTADPQNMAVGVATGGATVWLDSSTLQGGSLGGLMTFRDKDLTQAQNSLGLVATGLAQTLNNQQQLGQDLNGAPGVNLFTLPSPVVLGNTNNSGTAVVTASVSAAGALSGSDYRLTYTGANYTLTRLSDNTTTTYASLPQTVDGLTISSTAGAAAGDSYMIEPTRNAAAGIAMNVTNPAQIAAAAPIIGGAANANTGSGVISAGSVNAPPPPNANLLQPVTITFTSPTTFNVTGTGTGNPGGVSYTAGANITYNGWTVKISGAPAVGDSFTVSANSSGTADGRNALLMSGLQTQNTLANGTTTFQGAYAQMVSAVGNQAQQVNTTATAQTALVSQATQAQQSLSGVNLDEEAANLLQYQNAYQAAAKMIATAQTLFQTILTAMN